MCDNVFTLCVFHTGHNLQDMENIELGDCPLGFYVSDKFDNSDNISESISATFTGISWPVSPMILYSLIIKTLVQFIVMCYVLWSVTLCVCVGFLSAAGTSLRC